MAARKAIKVVVIGGGVAGMEAARAANARGHRVVLIERSEKLGGHLIEASKPEFKADLRKLLEWYRRQMEKTDIEVLMGKEVSESDADALEGDVIILASGSVPVVPAIRGVDKPFVVTCSDVLSGSRKTYGKTIILGGGLEGCETGCWISQQGCDVSIIEQLGEIAGGIHSANSQMLRDMVARQNIEVLTHTTIQEILDGHVVLKTTAGVQTKSCDAVVLAVGLKPVANLWNSLRRQNRRSYRIGDCKEARNVHYAILEGFTVGSSI